MAKTIKKIIAFTLAFLCGAIAGMSLILVKGDWKGSILNSLEQNHATQLSFGSFFENGITLTASAEEISSPSNNVHLTATLLPEETTVSRKVDWSIAWKNASSTWAKGKTLNDYVTLTPTSSGALTADLECKQAFGEPIIVTVTSQANPNATATCQVDYAQKVTSASLNFGNVAINLGGDTYVEYELRATATGPGGVVTADMQTSSVYTITQDFQTSVTLKSVSSDELFRLKGGYPTGFHQSNQLNTHNWLGESIYYDYTHDIQNWLIMSRTSDISFSALSISEIIEQFENMQCSTMYEITLTIAGEYNTYAYTSTMYCSGYTNTVMPTEMSVDYAKVVF